MRAQIGTRKGAAVNRERFSKMHSNSDTSQGGQDLLAAAACAGNNPPRAPMFLNIASTSREMRETDSGQSARIKNMLTNSGLRDTQSRENAAAAVAQRISSDERQVQHDSPNQRKCAASQCPLGAAMVLKLVFQAGD
jgi:hypothetical protein